MAYPKCEADWRMGEYLVECNTNDQVSVMVCDQQILKARLTGRRSIEAALKICRHQARSWPPPEDGDDCCAPCCRCLRECWAAFVGCIMAFLALFNCCGCSCKCCP